ncbi:PIN domain-containing protein [Pyrococcus kukulkanii]|uniref:PIN domain-containing protein n=1 Tax=Pyrococcus kukulkanii TaxID=1609559 RepID=UPI0035655877
MNLLFETELTQKAQKLFSLAENPVVSETVIDECIYTTLRKKASRLGIRSIYEVKRFIKTSEGLEVLKDSIQTVLSFIMDHQITIVRDPDIFLTIVIAEKYGLLPHDAKIVGAMIENEIRKIVTLDRDFSDIPIISVLTF